MSIDEFIGMVMSRLKNKVAVGEEEWSGADLKLSGMKMPKGGWIDNVIYKIKVPVEMKTTEEEHRTNLRLAWIKSGKIGVRAYLDFYVPEKEKMDSLMSVLDNKPGGPKVLNPA